MYKSHQKGYTMLEVIAALSVITVITIGSISVISNMFDKYRLFILSSQVQDIQKFISTRYRLEGNYSDLRGKTAAQFESEQLIPKYMVSGAKLLNRVGGEVQISPVDCYTGTAADGCFQVVFQGIDVVGCMELSQITWNNSPTIELVRMKINSTTFELPIKGVSSSASTLPVTVQKASGACTKSNSMTWVFQ